MPATLTLGLVADIAATQADVSWQAANPNTASWRPRKIWQPHGSTVDRSPAKERVRRFDQDFRHDHW